MAAIPTRNGFLAACLQALRSADIPFCISRNHHQFWEDGPSDVDMMVSIRRIKEAVACLESAALQAGYNLVARTLFDNLCLVFHAPGAGYVRLDLDTAVRWRTRTLLAADVVLDNRIEYNGLPIPCPEHEALVLLCQCAWAGKAKSSYRDRLRALTANDVDAARVTGFLNSHFAFDRESLSRLIAAESTNHLRECLRRAGQPKDRFHNSFALIRRSIERIHHPPGIVILCPGLRNHLRKTTAAKMELVLPSAKAARGGNAITQILGTVFRGGIVWADTPNPSIGVVIALAWVGKWRSFRWADGQIQHIASGQSAPGETAHDFIGSILAEGRY